MSNEQETESRSEDEEKGQAEEDEQEEKGQDGEDEEDVEETMKKVQEDPPENLEDWPEGRAKYETFGGAEGEHSYEEGPEPKLGPSSLRHHEDGNVSIAGEEVEDPDEYKGDPIPGGPTDPNAPQDLTTERIRGGTASGDDDDDEEEEEKEEKEKEG